MNTLVPTTGKNSPSYHGYFFVEVLSAAYTFWMLSKRGVSLFLTALDFESNAVIPNCSLTPTLVIFLRFSAVR